ncbi:sodium/proline symporter [Clostridium boliviensis]|uniref:Sodium/proline symporter n=1 Tax=Clostridium boliviensis TaxID=318465 RepID=A0ABU4GSA2_9CLOT|nr:sodium/proline symporter [Clostridium boliviensis]MDW2800438.1 sodium/proline symporter [Clostridium boliviensis]
MSIGQVGILSAILVYLMVMVYIGFYYSKKGGGDTSDDFYLGGRKLGPLVTAMSAEASDMSSWLLMGLPGVAYMTGIADAGWTAVGLAAGTYLNWILVAKRLRRYSVVCDTITLPAFFSRRYRDDKNVLMCISAVIILVFFIPYTASGFKAIGTLFNSLFHADYHTVMILGAIVVVGYTVMGGFMAVSTTDLIQSIVMSISLIIIVFYGISISGGWERVMENAGALEGYLSMSRTHNLADQTSSPYGIINIVSTMAWGLGYFGMPHILLRFMAISDEKKLTTSRRIASTWVVISMLVAILIGIIGYSVSIAGHIPFFASGSEAETVIIRLAGLLGSHSLIFSLLAGVVLAGILACTMSTADSQLLTAASGVSQNLMQDFLKLKVSHKTSMLAARLTVIGVALIAVFLAWDPDRSVFTIVSFAWAGFGASFGPVMLFALFWKRSNFYGAVAGMISGGAMVFIWKYLVRPMGGIFNIYELLPAFTVACAAIVTVSLLTPEPDLGIYKEFDLVNKK